MYRSPKGYIYETCVQDEVVDRIESILNCAPPWMLSDKLQNVCTGNLNVSSKEYRIVGTIFSDQYNTYKSTDCKMACKSPAYEIVNEYEASFFFFSLYCRQFSIVFKYACMQVCKKLVCKYAKYAIDFKSMQVCKY